MDDDEMGGRRRWARRARRGEHGRPFEDGAREVVTDVKVVGGEVFLKV